MIFGRIRSRLLLGFLLLSPLPLAGLAYVYVRAFESAQHETVLAHISAIADKKDDEINAYLDERLADSRLLARSITTADVLRRLSGLAAREGMSSVRYRAAERRFREHFENLFGNVHFYDLLLADAAGNVVFSVRHEPDLGTNLNSGPYRDTALAHAHREALALLDTQMSPAEPYAPSGDAPAIFLVTPVIAAGRPIGSVALQLDLDHFSAAIADTTGLGETGETVLAQRGHAQALYISPLRRIADAAFRHRVSPERLDEPMKAAFNGGYGAGVSRDYAGAKTVAAWRYLPALRSGMVVMMEAAEAFAPARRLRFYTISAFVALLLVAGLTALALGHALVAPIRRLMTTTRRIADGDLTQRAAVHGLEELRQLAISFNSMADRIGEQHATLEQRVAERTRELQELNATLEQRVDEAVRKNMEQERMLVHQSRHAAMGEMIGNIAHQWRQPLQAITLILGNIKDRYALHELNEETLHAEIARARAILKQMSRTVDDFRDFFRPDRAAEVFELDSSVKETLSIMGATLKNNDIDVIEYLELGLKVYGYPSQLAQAVLNVMANAKETIQERKVEKGRIEIALARSGRQGVLTIQDNGGGIADRVLPRMFDPFFTTKAQGSGIGLYMAKTIVERNHKGTIRAENHGPGARIVICLPLWAEGAES